MILRIMVADMFMKNYNLLQGDCLDKMVELAKDNVKVNSVICDPPYGSTDLKWDGLLDFNLVWKCLDKLLVENGSCLFFGSEPFSTVLRQTNLDEYKYDLYWIKNRSTGFVHAKNKPLKNIELISVFSKGVANHKNLSSNRMTYNPQGLIRVDKKIKAGDSKFGNMHHKCPSHKKEYVRTYTNYPKMVIEFDTVPTNKSVHPTQKPVELLEYLIKTYTNPEDTVLDFTMGSGSTGVACLNTGRKFIGIEKDEKYFNIATERIGDADYERL